MANPIEDQFTFIINDCIYSSSQEHLLLRSNFALENDTLLITGAGKSPVVEDYSGGQGNYYGRRGGGGREIEFANLGYGGEIDASEVLFEGGVKVNVVRPLRCVALDGGGELGLRSGEKDVEFVENVVIDSLKDGESCVKVDGVGNVGVEGVEEAEDCVEIGGVSNVRIEGFEDGENRVEGVGSEGIEGLEDEENCVNVEGVGNVGAEGVEEAKNPVKVGGVVNVGIKGLEAENHVEGVEDGENCVEGLEDKDNLVEVDVVGTMDTEVIEVDEEGVGCGEVDEGMGKDEEIGNVDTEVIEVVKEEENRVEGVGNVDVEVVKEEENGVKVVGLGNVDDEVIDGVKEGVGYVEAVDEKGENCERGIGNVVIDVIGDDDEGGNPKKIGDICDLEDWIIGFEKVLEIFMKGDRVVKNNVDMEVVGVNKEQGGCRKVDGETGEVAMEEIQVEEEMSGKLPSEDASRGENTKINEEKVPGKKRKLPRSMFEQWSSGLGNGEGSSKDANFKENGSEKSLDGEASYKCISDALKFLVGEKVWSDDEVDFFETAKRRGMTFPPPRFRKE